MNDLKTIDKRINDVVNSNMPARQLSKVSGVPYSTISRIRTGHIELDNVSYTNIKRLYNASINE